MTYVVWLNFNEPSPPKGYWCYGWLEETFSGDRFTEVYSVNDVPPENGAIIVIPAEYNVDYVDHINATIESLPWAVVILASDERGLFPVEHLSERITSLWVMTPHFEKHTYPPGTQFIGVHYPQDARERIMRTGYYPERPLRWSFSGQITHQRRHELVEALEETAGGFLNKTAGFTQGLGRDDYYDLINRSVSVPAPSGPVTLDSFRAYEALEAGAIPILDLMCPLEQDGERYWNEVLGEGHPLPTVRHWSEAIPIIEDNAEVWPAENNRVYAWWQLHKRELRYRILEGVEDYQGDDITVLIPTSPIPSHPSTEIIEETINSVRFHYPSADILIMIDGVRDEQLDRTDDYEMYTLELLDACNFKWNNVYPILFEDHQHQANMTRAALNYVHTPLILFVEHDTPLVTDEPIDWHGITTLMTRSTAYVPDVVRFHFEAHVHPEHEHLMIDHETHEWLGVPLRRTLQWSQRPHLANTDYYRRIIHDNFPATGRTMIEDKMHSVVQCEPDQHAIAIYHPETGNIKRSAHTDGRQSDPKFGMVYE